ncbi:MAG: DUF2892 domain-containing protein [Anaerolineales bacterium]|nr:DUF2892 domain-containing protein [Anaerolineales bacterium]
MQKQFVEFMASGAGRGVRIVAGLLIMALGLLVVGGVGGVVIAVIGFVPLFAGVYDVCLFAPLMGQPFKGKDVRGEK